MAITINGNGTVTGLTAAPNLTSSGLTTGKILQVVKTNITTTSSASVPNASLVDTPATVNITSIGANSKFIISGCISGEGTQADHVIGIVLRRVIGGSGASINVGDSSGSRSSITSIHQQGLHSSDNASTPSTCSMSAYVDSPSQAAGTTITYKYALIGLGYTCTYYFGRAVSDVDNSSYERMPNHITVMELAA